jgi:uncharacterized membrane protein YgcG
MTLRAIVASPYLKDLDLAFKFRLEAGTRDRLVRQLAEDCALLEELRVMDYSLLVGVHFRQTKTDAEVGAGRAWQISLGYSTSSDAIQLRERGFKNLSMMWRAIGQADIPIARHVIGCHCTLETTRVQGALCDVAGNIYQALRAGAEAEPEAGVSGNDTGNHNGIGNLNGDHDGGNLNGSGTRSRNGGGHRRGNRSSGGSGSDSKGEGEEADVSRAVKALRQGLHSPRHQTHLEHLFLESNAIP